MTLFRLDASIRTEGSASREIADIVEDEWRAVHPDEAINRRHIGIDVLPADSWPLAVGAMSVPPSDLTADHLRARTLAATLVDEMLSADAILLAIPPTTSGSRSTPRPGSTW